MSILTKDEILKEIKAKRIIIEPFRPKNIGPGSIDLTLGNKFRVFDKMESVVDVKNNTDYTKITKLLDAESILVLPGDTVLGITEEKITIPDDICGWLEGRSRFARLGLMVHISASFMQPGISNRQVLEISNMGHAPLRLHSGTKICQFIFQRTIGKAKYKGNFKEQTEP
jgi:dCTP deaminase